MIEQSAQNWSPDAHELHAHLRVALADTEPEFQIHAASALEVVHRVRGVDFLQLRAFVAFHFMERLDLLTNKYFELLQVDQDISAEQTLALALFSSYDDRIWLDWANL